MNAVLSSPVLSGVITVPASKSELHRLLILAAFSDRPTAVFGVSDADDIKATCGVLTALGAGISYDGEKFDVLPICSLPASVRADCRGSASTLRFFIPIFAALGVDAELTVDKSLSSRPIADCVKALAPHGVSVLQSDGMVKVSGKLTRGDYEVSASLSSQFTSGMLLSLSLLKGESRLSLSGKTVSEPYIDLTVGALSAFGVPVTKTAKGFTVTGGALRSSSVYRACGDYSSASFFLVAGAVGASPVTVKGLAPDTGQGDRAVLSLLRDFGADVRIDGDAVTVNGGDLHGIDLDILNTPDLFPPLAVLAACAKGNTRFFGAERLRYKESDRLRAVGAMLEALGIRTAYGDGVFTVCGGTLRGGVVDSFSDHRIAMSAAIAATAAEAPVTVLHAECVKKSYPGFWRDYYKLIKTENPRCLLLTETI